MGGLRRTAGKRLTGHGSGLVGFVAVGPTTSNAASAVRRNRRFATDVLRVGGREMTNRVAGRVRGPVASGIRADVADTAEVQPDVGR